MKDFVVEKPVDLLPGLPEFNGRENRAMSLVWCIIRPESLEPVKQALTEVELIGGMTITDVRGFGRQKGSTEHYRGEPYTIRFVPKVRLEVAVASEDVNTVMTAVHRSACTGQVGDGKVFVLNLPTTMRIRTGERGVGAL